MRDVDASTSNFEISFISEYPHLVISTLFHRSWFGWKLPEDKEMLIPDVSRTIRREYLGLTEHAEFIRDYFNKPRKHSMLAIKMFINHH